MRYPVRANQARHQFGDVPAPAATSAPAPSEAPYDTTLVLGEFDEEDSAGKLTGETQFFLGKKGTSPSGKELWDDGNEASTYPIYAVLQEEAIQKLRDGQYVIYFQKQASGRWRRGLYFGKIYRRDPGDNPKVKWVNDIRQDKDGRREPTTSGKSETITRRAGLTFAKGEGQRELLYIIKEVTKGQVIENHGNPVGALQNWLI